MVSRVHLVFAISLACFTAIQGQTFDQLNANTSAAFVLMGISPTEIATPTNVGEFAASVQDATQNLSVLPENYAVEVPIYSTGEGITKRNRITLSGGYSRENLNVDIDSRVGVGFKLSLISQKQTNASNKRLTYLHEKQEYARLMQSYNSTMENANIKSALTERTQKLDFELFNIQNLEDEEKIDANNSELDTKKKNQNEAFIKKEVSRIESERASVNEALYNLNIAEKLEQKIENDRGSAAITSYIDDLDDNTAKVSYQGLFWDAYGGTSYSLGQTSFSDIAARTIGLWTNIGYELENTFSLMATSKFVLDDINTVQGVAINEMNTSFDFGLKTIYTPQIQRLEISAEYIYRSRSLEMLGNSWKGLINITYDIGNNQKLTLALGKNFDNKINKEGNVISLLNFVSSFGNKN